MPTSDGRLFEETWQYVETIEVADGHHQRVVGEFPVRHPEFAGLEGQDLRIDVICGRDRSVNSVRFWVRRPAISPGDRGSGEGG